jgi:hypothetical protein
MDGVCWEDVVGEKGGKRFLFPLLSCAPRRTLQPGPCTSTRDGQHCLPLPFFENTRSTIQYFSVTCRRRRPRRLLLWTELPPLSQKRRVDVASQSLLLWPQCPGEGGELDRRCRRTRGMDVLGAEVEFWEDVLRDVSLIFDASRCCRTDLPVRFSQAPDCNHTTH